jgi:sugar O-acyltransferase (sialic acid O-acetyltransferase NeuD family)
MKNIVIFGSGGHAKVILNEILDFKSKYNFIGFVDNSKKVGTNIVRINKKNFKIIDLKTIKIKNLYGVIGIGDNYLRYKNYKLLIDQFESIKWQTIISRKSIIKSNVNIGSGSVILANSFIGSGSEIKEHCIINSSTSIDHDNKLESFTSTGPGVITGGNVNLKKFSHLGIGCIVKNNIRIDENVICGGKSFINKNCKKNSVYYGVPSKFIKSRKLGQKYL